MLPPSPLFEGLSVEFCAKATPGELAAWCRQRRAEAGIVLDGPLCPTCGGDGVLEGGDRWCADCTGNGIARAPVCRLCGGQGVVRLEDRTIATCPECRGGAARFDGLLDRARVPPFYQHFTWDTYAELPEPSDSQGIAYAAAMALASDPDVFELQHGRRGLCLSGPAGTRKTGICTPAFSDLALRSDRPRFVSWRAWLDEYKRTWRDESAVSSAEYVQRAAKADVLMLDDFAGAGGIDRREWVAETAWKLLELRQSVEGVTLVTTNRTLAEIGTSFGDPVASRLAAACLWLDVTGTDERRRAA
jgi:DNA replication protein DnaC